MLTGIYSPYLNILGGGERYILTMGKYLTQRKAVDVFWDDLSIKEEFNKYLKIDLKGVNFVPNIFRRENLLKRMIYLHKYGTFIYVTDGSLFFSPARKNLLIIQSPAHCPKVDNLSMKLKFSSWHKILCYSDFVKKIIDKRLPRPALVLPPPVDVDSFKPLDKKNIILSVGRFFPWLHSKKQEVLIEAFKKLCQEGLRGWQLYLVGKSEKGAEDYLEKVRKEAEGYPIEILTDVSFRDLVKIYGHSKIYWHATGFGEDLVKHPERAEHFGITTVEAMSAGCVPLIINAGAQPEIVEDKKSCLWETLEQLQTKTLNLINNKELLQKLSFEAELRSQNYSQEKFFERLDEVLE